MKNLKEKRAKAAKIIRALKSLFPKAEMALRYSNQWELLVAVMLSAQCTDKKVNEVTEKLFRKYKALRDYAKAKRDDFEKDIRPTGFYRQKAKNILTAAKIVMERYSGRLPKTMEEMLTLPGVARKTANIVLGQAYGVIEGIAIDTHVRRLAKLLGLTEADDPVKIERRLKGI